MYIIAFFSKTDDCFLTDAKWMATHVLPGSAPVKIWNLQKFQEIDDDLCFLTAKLFSISHPEKCIRFCV